MSDQRPLVVVGMDPDVPGRIAADMQHEAEKAAPEYRFLFITGATTATVLPTIPMPSYRGAEERRR